MKKYILFLSILLCASQLFSSELTDLYMQRMKAENSGNSHSLYLLDHAIAEEYMSQRNYELARLFWEKSMNSAPCDSAVISMKLNLLRLDIVEAKISAAESGLLSLYFDQSIQKDQKYRINYLLCLLSALNGDYDHCREYFSNMVAMDPSWPENSPAVLDSLFKKSDLRKNKSKARLMSGFLPGSGQIYAKNGKGALGAIGLAVFWGGMFTYDIIQQDYYSALVVLLWPWQRYHRGNIMNAAESVQQYNLKIQDEINRTLLQYLAENE